MTYDKNLLDNAISKNLIAAFPNYKISPLSQHSVGERMVWVKDETDRMGLGSFKALGGGYAVARILQTLIGKDLFSEKLRPAASEITFVCASAGNHGLSVAAGAELFGAHSRIHLSATVPASFARRLEQKGAQVVRSGQNYEESVTAAIADAASSGAIHLADGSWPGYTEKPRLVMEGYTLIAEEMRECFESSNEWPSHVYLQAGVGGLAAAMAFMIRKNWAVQPEIIVVEPDAAPCLEISIKAGRLLTASGPVSNMGRLDCKTASMIAFEILQDTANKFVTISDELAEQAVSVAVDIGFATTPSGAAGLAALLAENKMIKNPLIILTEGI